MEMRALVVLVFTVASTNAIPINSEDYQNSVCSKECKDTSKFSYTAGTTYVFKYESGVNSEVSGSRTENSGLQMTATVQIEVFDKCNMALSLSDVKLNVVDPVDRNKVTLSEGNSEFKRSMEENPLRFSFQDGQIEHVCSDENSEEINRWVLNMKKGILSTFQNSMEDLLVDTKVIENDVTGSCTTHYKVTNRGWNSITVTKTKDLLGCLNRQGYRMSLQATPYRVLSDFQSFPLMKGTHECVQTLSKTGRLLKSECTELHIFRPFSKGVNGASTKATHVLEFIRETAGIRTPSRSNARRSDMFFDHEINEVQKQNELLNSINLLKEICQKVTKDIRPETPKLFSNLVYQLKRLDASSLKDLHRRITSNAVCSSNHKIAKKYFHDAVPMVGTTASVSLISALITNQHIRESEADMWVTSLAFIAKPSADMILSVSRLLEGRPRKTAFLSVSAMVNNYCKHIGPQCHTQPEVIAISTVFERRLNTNCRFTTPQERDYVVMTLRAIGNMGNSPALVRRLHQCMKESTNPIDIRLASIDAYRRMPCSSDNTYLIDLYTNKKEDTEVRIAAYLALMHCASPELLETIKNTMLHEEVNQVGSFVWSHLNNLMQTDDVHKQNIRKILDEGDFSKKFNMDWRKFSRNYESSYFSDATNMGMKAESNIVMSPTSYIPRFGNLNLTIDLFGQSVNLLEVGGRVQGLEEMIERFFGPKGYFDNSLKDTIKRARRNINDINRLHDQYLGNTDDRKLKGNLYFRVFGHEMSYVDLMKSEGDRDEFNILELLIRLAKDHDVDISKSYMFLDTTMTIPLMTGMPLKLSVNGTATINLKIKGKLDMRKLGSSPRSLDINGHIKPSGAVEISSLMGVDAFVTRTGLKMVTTLHSSTEVDGTIKMQDSQIVNLKFNMPRDKMEILNFENKFYIIHRETEREQTMLLAEPTTKRSCSSSYMTKLSGLEICSEMSYPNYGNTLEPAQYPLAGPVKVEISLNKRDSHNSYEFEAKLLTKKNRIDGVTFYHHEAKLAFNTPNSATNRQLLLDFNLDRAAKTLAFNLVSPWKKVSLEGEVLNDEYHKRVSGILTVDDNRKYSVLGEIKATEENGRKIITPKIEVRIHNRNTVTLRGRIEHVMGSSFHTDFSLENLFQEPVSIKTDISILKENGNVRYNMAGIFHSQLMHSNVKGFVGVKRGRRYASRIEIDYGKQKKPEHRVVLNNKMRIMGSTTYRRIMVDTAVESTQYPDYAFHTSLDLQGTNTGHYEGQASMQYGRNPDDTMKKADLKALLKYNNDEDVTNIESSASFKYPAIEADLAAKFVATHKPSIAKANALLQWATEKQISTDITYRKEEDTHHVEGEVALPNKQPFTFNGDANLNPNDFKLAGQINNEGKIYIGNVEYSGDGYLNHDVTANLQLPETLPMKFKATGKLDMMNFEATADLNIKDQRYYSKLVYTLHMSDMYPTINGNFEFMHPERRSTGVLSISTKPNDVAGNLVLKWDVDRDPTKVLQSKMKYKREVGLISGDGEILYPGRAVKCNYKFENEGNTYSSHFEGQWSEENRIIFDSSMTNDNSIINYNGKNIIGRVSLKTPYKNIQDVGAQFTYTKEDASHRGNIELTLAANKKITGDMIMSVQGIKNFEVKLTAETPFNGYKKLGAHLKNVIQEKTQLSTKISLQAGNKGIDIQVDGRRSNPLELKLKIETPFENVKLINAHFKHEKVDDMFKLKLEMHMEPKIDKISLTTDISARSWRDFSAKMTFFTPIEIISDGNLELVNLLSNKELRITAKGSLKTDNKFEVSTVLMNNNSPERRDMEATIKYKFVSQTRSCNREMKISHNDDNHKYNSQLGITKNSQLMLGVDMSGEHAYDFGTRRIIGTLIVTSPQIENVKTTFHYVRSEMESLESKVTIFHGITEGASFELNLKKDGSFENIDASLNWDISGMVADTNTHLSKVSYRIKTHYSGFPYTTHLEANYNDKRFEIDVSHEKRSEIQYFSSARAVYMGKTTDIESLSELYEGTMKTNVKITSPYKHLRRLNIDLEQSKTTNGITQKQKVNYRGDEYHFDYDSNLDISSWTTHVFSMHMTSNIPRLENILIKTDQSIVNTNFKLVKTINIGEMLNLDSTFTVNFNKINPSSSWVAKINNHQININGNGLYADSMCQADLTLIVVPSGKPTTSFEVTGKYGRSDKSLSLDIKLTTPLVKDNTIKITHIPDNTSWRTSFEADVDDIGHYEIKATLLKSFEQGTLSLRSPHGMLSSVDATLDLNPDNLLKGSKINGEMTYQNGKKASLSGHVDINSPQDISLELKLNSESVNYDFMIEKKFDEGESTTAISLTASGSKYEYLFNYQHSDPFILKIKLSTPIQLISSFVLDIMHDGSWDSFTHKFLFEYNIYVARVRLQNDWQVKGLDLIKGALKLTSPISNYEFLILTVDHQREGGKWTTEAEYNRVSQQRLEFKQEVNLDDKKYKLDMKTPWEVIRAIKVEAEHDDIKSKLEIEIPDYKLDSKMERSTSNVELDLKAYGPSDAIYEFKGIYDMGSTSKVSLTLRTPHEVMSETNVDLSYGGDWVTDLHSKLMISHNKFSKSVIVVLSYDLSKKDFEFTFNGPWESNEIILKHSKTSSNSCITEVKFVYNEHYVNIDSRTSLFSLNNWRGTVTLMSSIPRLESTQFTFGHVGDIQSFTNNLGLNSQYYGVITTEITWSTQPHYNAKLVVKTPFESWKKMKVTFNHVGSSAEFTTIIKLKREEKQLSSTMTFKNDGGIEANVMIVTPFEGYRTLSCAFSYRGEWEDFQTSLTVIKPGKKLSIDGKFKHSDDTECRIVVKTPFEEYKHLEFYMKHVGGRTKFTNTGMLQIKQGTRIDTKMDVNTENLEAISLHGSLKTPLEKMHQLEATYTHTGNRKAFKCNGNIKVNGEVLTGTIDFKMPSNEDIYFLITAETPYTQAPKPEILMTFKNIGETFEGQFSSKSGLSTANYNVGFTLIQGSSFEMKSKIFTPISCMSMAEFELKVSDDFKTSFSINHEEGQTTGSMIFNMNWLNGLDMKSSLLTPFDVSGHITASISDGWRKYNGETAFKWAADKQIIFKENTQFSSTGLDSRSSVQTPFETLDILSLELFYKKQECSANLVAEIGSGKKSFIDVHLKKEGQNILSLRTPYDNIKNVKLTFQKAIIDNKDGIKVEFSWKHGKTIVLESGWKHNGVVFGKTFDMDTYTKITTPWESMSYLTIDIDHKRNTQLLNSEMVITYNAHHYNWKINIAKDATKLVTVVELKSPQAMRLDIDIGKTGNDISGNIVANWDTNSQEKNVKVNMVLKDGSNYFTEKKEVTVKVILPWRIMGFETKYDKTTYKLTHFTKFTLDERNERWVAYDLMVNDQSKTYSSEMNGEFSIITPLRTIKSLFKHYRTNFKHEDSIDVMWDAEKDMGKKFGLNSIFERNGKEYTAKLILTHPKLPKPITASSRLSLDVGNSILDFTTQLDYSMDPRDLFSGYAKIVKLSSNGFGYEVTTGFTHLKSNSNTRIKSITMDTSSRMQAGIEVKYIGRIVEFRTELDKIGKTFLVKIPVFNRRLGHVIFDGKLIKTSNGYKSELTRTYGLEKINAEIDINTKTPSIDVRIHHDSANPSNMLHLYGKYLSHKQLKIEAYRLQDGSQITDALVTFYMNTTRLLHTRIHWRPETYREVKADLQRRLDEYRERLSSLRSQISDAYKRTKSERYSEIINGLPDVSELQEYIAAEAKSFKNDREFIKTDFLKMYDGNELLVKDAHEMLKSVVSSITNRLINLSFHLKQTKALLTDAITQRVAYYRRKWTEAMNKLQDNIADIVLKFRPEWQKHVYFLISKYNLAAIKLTHTLEEMMEAVQNYKNQIVKYIDEQFDFISYRLKPYWEKLSELRSSLRSTLATVDDDGFIKNLKEFLEKHSKNIKVWADNVEEKLGLILERTQTMIDEQMEKIMGHEATQIVIENVKKIRAEVERMYNEYEVENNLRLLADQSLKIMKKTLRSQIKEIAKNFLLLDKSGFTVWDPKNGEIQAEIYLPTEIKHLNKLPEFNAEQLKKELNKLYRKFIPKTDLNFKDYFYIYKPSTDIYNWLPPFKGHASILGKNHFVTFDHRFYDFVGSCSYILAHDFVDKTFTFLVNYEGGERKSITIQSGDKKIEIFPDYKVTIDDRQTELPMQIASTSIIRVGSIVRIHNEKGFTVACNMVTELCDFNLSGWYYGKTAGLLGTFSHESSDDFITSTGQTVDDVDEFTKSWQVGPYCRSTRTFAVQPLRTGSAVEKCSKLFNQETSQLRLCYKLVNPKIYMDMCLKDVSTVYNEDLVNEKICAVSALYVSHCKTQGVPIRRPKYCTKCQSVTSSVMTEGQELRIKASEIPATRSADVIFVVEEKQCNKDVAPKLQDLAMQINAALLAEGKQNNRFGIVGFGGPNVHNWENMHTMENLIFNDVRKIRLGAQILDFTEDGSNDDTLRAIRYAALYPFRAGVAKVVIAIPCSQCVPKAFEYTEMQTLLNKRDIHLHILMSHDFKLRRTSSPKSNFIFGADETAVFTSKDVHATVLTGDEALHRQVNMPKDICVELAYQRKGSVFNVQKLLEGRVNSQKYFLDVFARRIAKTAKATECQICDCTADPTGLGMTVCRPCEIPSPKYRYLSGLFGHKGERPTFPEPDPMVAPLRENYEMNYEEINRNDVIRQMS